MIVPNRTRLEIMGQWRATLERHPDLDVEHMLRFCSGAFRLAELGLVEFVREDDGTWAVLCVDPFEDLPVTEPAYCTCDSGEN